MTANPVATVTDELLEELEQLASKATPGPWWIDSHGNRMVSEYLDHETVFIADDKMGPAVRHSETGNLSHWPNDWDASFIAQANPATIIALLNHIRTMQQELKAAHISVDNCELFRKDAERMAWLISRGDSMQWMNIIKVDPDEFETLDGAIDAAMTASHSD